MKVLVLDYGSGNLRSAERALIRASSESGAAAEVRVTADPETVRRAERIVLPGVGAFADCMAGLSGIPGLVHAVRSGTVEVVNRLGSGVVQNHAVSAFAGPLCRRLLSEEPILQDLPTLWLGDAASLVHPFPSVPLERTAVRAFVALAQS